MTAQEMWEMYSQKEHISAPYDAWAFGDDADTLADLVLRGIKTATASAGTLYALDGDELPKVGEYSVVLNSRKEAVCVIRTTRVFTVPFRDVDALQAYREGEGDRSLDYWREVHERFFTEELREVGISFDWNIPVVCEEFLKVFP